MHGAPSHAHRRPLSEDMRSSRWRPIFRGIPAPLGTLTGSLEVGKLAVKRHQSGLSLYMDRARSIYRDDTGEVLCKRPGPMTGACTPPSMMFHGCSMETGLISTLGRPYAPQNRVPPPSLNAMPLLFPRVEARHARSTLCVAGFLSDVLLFVARTITQPR